MAARSGERWIVSTWPRTLKYNQAITALTLTERLAAGHGDDDPFVVAWREELAHGVAGWSLGVGIVATVGANLAHGLGHGPIGALVSAWPALALVGSYELLMMLIRTEHGTTGAPATDEPDRHAAPHAQADVPPEPLEAPSLEQTVRARYETGDGRRAIAREVKIDRRKVKRIIEQPA